MIDRLRIALAQINPVVGDLAGNVRLHRDILRQASDRDADLVIFPELSVSGYPPEDLVLRPAYLKACAEALEEIARATANGPAAIVGVPIAGEEGARPFNGIVLCQDGEIKARRHKTQLPGYGVFDEPRTFAPATATSPVPFRGLRLGLMICEDMWYPHPARSLAADGADIFIVPHGSPFRQTVAAEREFEAAARIAETGRPLIFVNQVGGQDELVFDGGAFVARPEAPWFRAPVFQEGLFLTDWTRGEGGWTCTEGPQADWPTGEALIYEALVVGTRDYVRKSGFSGIVLGLSGGIDSAMVAAIAADALGPENAHCVMLPSRYTSAHSLEDAAACAEALGCPYRTIEIEPGVEAFDAMLSGSFADQAADVTEENIQSRLRGSLLMALSNKFGWLMLTTGNKSEMAVGYATLYGDMNGAFNPLKDVYKTEVFRLARWRNGQRPSFALGPEREVIPERIITKPPSAELREDQKDEDSLPPYDVLDAMLHGLIEDEASVEEIVARGHDRTEVLRVQTLLYRAEYKRRQAPPGPKVSTRNFGRDRRYPIVNRFSEG